MALTLLSPPLPNHIRIPHTMVSPARDLDSFISSILGSSMTEHTVGHHIFTPRNEDVDMLHANAIDMMPAPVRVHRMSHMHHMPHITYT